MKQEGATRGSTRLDRPVSSIMTTGVVRAGPNATLEALVEEVLRRGVGSVMIDDETGRTTGVVTKTDLLKRYLERSRQADGPKRTESGVFAEGRELVVAQDIMTPLLFFVPEETPILFAAALMAYEFVSHIPVVSDAGQVVGVVSAQDIVAALAANHGYVVGSHGARRARL